ncbi:permease [Frigoriglobus tundricola]|uniref:Putative membrane protein, YraQ family n=1 Tax=Frigoriglobus tundricola TaxID=2774151 RepID=A0A6M5Z2U6_9BACT|nr:permease [Frigoriglobus tundricola]QJX00396.1 putative membrane protein, YraQ family [Frigoriglobus tundricola]
MQPTILDFLISFSAVLWEAMPFIVLGAVVAGILEEFLPQEFITKLLPKSVVPAVMIGALLGLLFPMCECGIVVVMRRLLRKGLPLSCCIAYMLAGPIINLVVIFSTWVAFRDHKIAPEMVSLRVGLGFVIACTTALIVQIQYRKYGNALLTAVAAPPPVAAAPKPGAQPVAADALAQAPKKPLFVRIGNISATALHDFVDITVFLILGAVLAALARSYITTEQIETFSRDEPYLAIPAMMLLAVVMCLCSEADAFVAASFTKMHLTAKLAFLVLGPMLDIKLILMFTRVFRARLIVTIATCVVVLTLALCMLVHLVYQLNGWSGLPPGAG